ncbi:hypothetical protein LVJ94_24525 [Pendulispora rubella]|uniref:Uncharacterized protein n=1 Tax=Pendulispora rubella TaxID=2741070 RepID=A0ABZ2LMJ6_9BACT
MAYAGILCSVAVLAFSALSGVACVQEDWGGPKGPPLAQASAPPPAVVLPPDGGSGKTALTSGDASDLGASPSPGFDAAGSNENKDSAGLVPRVDATLSGGKIPGFDEAIAGMRSTLKACVDGKATPNARIEITAKIGPKGTVLKSDKVGGTSFAQGAVPCLMKRIEAAQFKKPTEGSPRITFRVHMSNE